MGCGHNCERHAAQSRYTLRRQFLSTFLTTTDNYNVCRQWGVRCCCVVCNKRRRSPPNIDVITSVFRMYRKLSQTIHECFLITLCWGLSIVIMCQPPPPAGRIKHCTLSVCMPVCLSVYLIYCKTESRRRNFKFATLDISNFGAYLMSEGQRSRSLAVWQRKCKKIVFMRRPISSWNDRCTWNQDQTVWSWTHSTQFIECISLVHGNAQCLRYVSVDHLHQYVNNFN